MRTEPHRTADALPNHRVVATRLALVVRASLLSTLLLVTLGSGCGGDGRTLTFLDVSPDTTAVDTAADDAAPPVAESCPGAFTWLDLSAISAERVGRPSLFTPDDTRAGSVDLHLNGDFGFGGWDADPRFAAGFLTLRNGAGQLVEELQINRRYEPASLDGEGCATSATFPQCWLDIPEDVVDGALVAAVPQRARDSNDGFDDSGERVAVAGSVRMEVAEAAPRDNSHETVRFTWEAPGGIAGTRMVVRGTYQPGPGPDGATPDPVAVPLLRVGWGARADDFEVRVPVLAEVERTETRLTVELNAQDALRFVCGFARGCEVRGEPRLDLAVREASWTLRNEGVSPVTFDAVLLSWPPENGVLEEVRFGDAVLSSTPRDVAPYRLEGAATEGLFTLPAGRADRLTLRFSRPVSLDGGAYFVRIDSRDGCMVELTRRSCRGGPDDCDDGGRPVALTLAYSGTNCRASAFAQDPAGVTCVGDPKFASPVRVVATDGGAPVESATTWFDGELVRGDTFALDPATMDQAGLPAITRVQVFTPGGDLLHEVTFSTACGVSLVEGDLFGAIRLDGCGAPGAPGDASP